MAIELNLVDLTEKINRDKERHTLKSIFELSKDQIQMIKAGHLITVDGRRYQLQTPNRNQLVVGKNWLTLTSIKE